MQFPSHSLFILVSMITVKIYSDPTANGSNIDPSSLEFLGQGRNSVPPGARAVADPGDVINTGTIDNQMIYNVDRPSFTGKPINESGGGEGGNGDQMGGGIPNQGEGFPNQGLDPTNRPDLITSKTHQSIPFITQPSSLPPQPPISGGWDGGQQNPGLNPGYNPGSNPGLNPGYNPGSNPGLNPGYNPGYNPGSADSQPLEGYPPNSPLSHIAVQPASGGGQSPYGGGQSPYGGGQSTTMGPTPSNEMFPNQQGFGVPTVNATGMTGGIVNAGEMDKQVIVNIENKLVPQFNLHFDSNGNLVGVKESSCLNFDNSKCKYNDEDGSVVLGKTSTSRGPNSTTKKPSYRKPTSAYTKDPGSHSTKKYKKISKTYPPKPTEPSNVFNDDRKPKKALLEECYKQCEAKYLICKKK